MQHSASFNRLIQWCREDKAFFKGLLEEPQNYVLGDFAEASLPDLTVDEILGTLSYQGQPSTVDEYLKDLEEGFM